MSLINDMLKDLQQQKENEARKTQLKPKLMEHIPFLPKPLMFAGGAVVLLAFVWWLAGILSEAMFEDVMVMATPAVQQSQVVQAAAQEPEKPLPLEPEEETLTAEERSAVPPVSAEPEAEPKARGIVAATSAPGKFEAQPVIKESSSITKKAPVSSTVSTKQVLPEPLVKKQSVKRTPVKAPAPVVVSAPKPLYPGQLPGVVMTPVRQAPVVEPLGLWPTRASVNTPYGMSDEAYLDGQWALSNRRSNLAVQSLQHALELYPGHLQARGVLVDILTEKGKSGEAMYLLAEGLEIAPDYMPFKKNYVRLLTEQDDFAKAIEVMMQGGMPAVDEDPEAHVLLATLYQHLGEPFLTAQTYRNLLVAWPQTGAFWVGLGSALEKQKLPGEAVKCYRRALETKTLRADLTDFARERLRLLNQG